MSSFPVTQLTPQGLTVARLQDRLNQLIAAFQTIFPNYTNTDPNAIDGQYIGIFAGGINDLDMLCEEVYNSFNPNTAAGMALSGLVQLNGITRLAGSFSTVVLTIGGTLGTPIAKGTTFSSADGTTQWTTDAACTISGSGFVSQAATCTVIGPQSASANTITKCLAPVFGFQTVTNPSSAVAGTAPETDQQLRIRRASSTTTPAQGPFDALLGALENVPTVTQVKLYENFTATTDGNGLLSHYIQAIVLGGATADVAEAIWLKRPIGPGMAGATTHNITDSAGDSHTISFDRPTMVRVYVILNMHSKAGFPSDGVVQLQNAIAALPQEIGQDLIWSSLFKAINQVAGVSVDTLFIGTSASPTTEVNIAMAFIQMPSIATADITVNVS